MAQSTLKLAATMALVGTLCAVLAPSCIMGQRPPRLCELLCLPVLLPANPTCTTTCENCFKACDDAAAAFVCRGSCPELVKTCESFCVVDSKPCEEACKSLSPGTTNCKETCDEVCQHRCDDIKDACTTANFCETAKRFARENCERVCADAKV